MRLALVALVLALPAASAAEAPAARPAAKAAVPARICSDAMRARHARSAAAPKLRRLGELPPGELTLTVVNQVGDCIEPLVVRQGIGAAR
jgi:hypothetical protein